MKFNAPLSMQKADRLIDLLALSPRQHILDVGCGTGEFLIRAIEASGATGLGIDIDGGAIAGAEESAADRVSPELVQFRAADIQQEQLEADAFDAAICIGSTHAYGMGQVAYVNTLQAFMRLVRPGGYLLIGEGYWKQAPAPEYLEFLGEPTGIYHTHEENITFAEAQGLVAVYATTSNLDEWDDFEWSHRHEYVRQAAENPEDATMAEKLIGHRKWLGGSLRWGRETMGFGFYLFMKPAG